MITTLYDTGFSNAEVETYMRLLLQEKETRSEWMLNARRSNTFNEIHFKEKQIDRLDYLRHSIRKKRAWINNI